MKVAQSIIYNDDVKLSMIYKLGKLVSCYSCLEKKSVKVYFQIELLLRVKFNNMQYAR